MSNESADEKVTNVKEEEGEEKHEEIVTESSSIMGTSMDIEETTEQTDQTVAGEAVNKSTGSVLTPFVEFAEDVDLRLGRANGNVFHRKQGVEGGHDGQIMVRLKKKRFVVIEYGIVPTECPIIISPNHYQQEQPYFIYLTIFTAFTFS